MLGIIAFQRTVEPIAFLPLQAIDVGTVYPSFHGNVNVALPATFASLAAKWKDGVILATQSVVSLGETQADQERILSNTTTVISFAVQFPEVISELAGTRPSVLYTSQIDSGQATEKGTVRPEREYKVHPDQIRQLDQGEGYVIRNGVYVRVKFNRAPDVPLQPEPKPTPPAPQPVSVPEVKPPVTKFN